MLPKKTEIVIKLASSTCLEEHNAGEPAFQPFVLTGTVSVSGFEGKNINILRDTGSVQSIILVNVLSLSDATFCQLHVLAQGIGMGLIKIPLYHIFLNLDTGLVRVGVCDDLPITAVSMILGNVLAGENIMPLLEVIEFPVVTNTCG